MIKGILFDKDGTLLKFDELWNEATKKAIPKFLDEIGVKTNDETFLKVMYAVEETIAALTYLDMVKAIVETLNMDVDKEMLHEYAKILEELYLEEVKKNTANIIPAANLHKLFKWLLKRNIIVGLATADTRQTALQCLDKLGITSFFSYIASDDGILKSKPATDIIDDFKNKFGINSDEIMVVGDTSIDMQFAKNGGAIAVGVLSGVGKEELKKEADYIFSDAEQIIYNWEYIMESR